MPLLLVPLIAEAAAAGGPQLDKRVIKLRQHIKTVGRRPRAGRRPSRSGAGARVRRGMTLSGTSSLGAAVIFAGAMLGACDSEKSGTPTGPNTDQKGTSRAGETSQPIPPVEQPLDASALLSSPCQALTSDDLAELGLKEGEARDKAATSTAKSCNWEGTGESAMLLDLSVMTENPNGLNDIYRNHENSELREEFLIGGYPALHASFNDNRPSGECSLWIGVNDGAVVLLDAYLRDSPEAEDPCGYADQVGEAIVSNLGS